jgi:three-Cys-motif partner protein
MNPDSWAAKLVLELQPHWMKTLHLCEKNKASFDRLSAMVEAQSDVKGRRIDLHHGDFNNWIDQVLDSGTIKDKTATFALLDQHSTECSWETVEKLAAHKQGDTKIELFYFFPTGWIHRTISGTKDYAMLDNWWGDNSWNTLTHTNQHNAAQLALERIRSLGYRDVKSWPISARKEGQGRTMYHMIHATDHLEAPKLMYRAYKNLIGGVAEQEQVPFEFKQTEL